MDNEARKIARHHLGERLHWIGKGGPTADEWIVQAWPDTGHMIHAQAATVDKAAADCAAQLRAIAAAPSDIAAMLSELDRLTAALAAAQPVVEWQDHPQVGLLGEDRSWSVVERGHFRLWVDVDGWHLLCSLPGLPANRSIASGPETGDAGKAACEAAYRRAVGLPPKDLRA